ncbi:hypothetical protein [Glutamicibacter sp. JC586]|nr:hypothetical protein [Glutamicibacter sp. JC586]
MAKETGGPDEQAKVVFSAATSTTIAVRTSFITIAEPLIDTTVLGKIVT